MFIRDINTSRKYLVDAITRTKGYSVSQNVSVTWSWYNQSAGEVQWTFHNAGSVQESVIWLRNGYYFGNAFWCFKPDELLLGDNKPISEYRPGDRVLGKSGLVRVVAVGKRWAKDGFIRIKASGMIPLEVTPEHPVLVVRNIHNKGGVKIIGFDSPEFIKAAKLEPKHTNQVGDYLVIAIPESIYDTKELDLTPYSKSVSRTPIKSIPLNEDVAWLLGLYCAEGWVSGYDKNNFYIALNVNETHLQERAINIVNNLGFTGRLGGRKGNGICVICSSRVLAKAFDDWCGHTAHNKKIPDFVLFHKNKNILKAFLDGLIAGDGCYISGKNGYIAFATVSKILAMQFQLAWLRFGRFANISIWKGGEGEVNGNKIHMTPQYRIRICKYENPHNKYAKFVGNFVYVPIRSVERVPYEGWVYDLQTEDNTIVASNVVTHNCVYLANSPPLCPSCTGQNGFGTEFLTKEMLVDGKPPVLVDKGVSNNSPPMAPVYFASGEQSVYNHGWQVVFVFTLAPGQTWSMVEAGFSDVLPPQPQGAYTVTMGYTGNMCIGYDTARVTDWDKQTGTSLQGWSPNPYAFSNLVTFVPEPDAPYDVLPFQDSISEGDCTGSGSGSDSGQGSGSGSGGTGSNPANCVEDVLNAVVEYQTNPSQAITSLIEGIICILNTIGYQVDDFIMQMVRSNYITPEEILKIAVEYDENKIRELAKRWLHI